jgi:sarcosine oxidase, subunit beta
VSGLLRGRTWWKRSELRKSYDVVIIGGGAHGLGTAYYLAKNHGVKNVAVLEKNYIGAGGSGRNTTILRSNYRTPEGIAFYERSMELYRGLSQELDINMMLSNHGHFTLAHTDSSVRVQRERAETNKLLGVDSRLIFRDEIRELCPELNLSQDVPYPIQAALYHPPGAVIRHDAVVWGYATGAYHQGVHIHQGIEVTGIRKDDNGRCVGVDTNQGPIDAGVVVCAVAGWTTILCDLAGVRTPITNHPLQAYVTESMKPVLHKILVSANLHVYISQTDRGEFLIGAEIEPYTTYNLRSTYTFVEHATANALDLLPFLARLKIMRQWTGYCDMTPDYSPIMGETAVENFYLDSGWGTWGFKASAVCGETMAELAATRRVPKLIEPFRLSRFADEQLVPEKAAASVSH